MDKIFPEMIKNLPKVELGIAGAEVSLSQGDDHQVLFMEFAEGLTVPEHSHGAQWGVVVKGEMRLTIAGSEKLYTKGDSYYIPAGTPHSAVILAGYADVTFFGQKDRYAAEEKL